MINIMLLNVKMPPIDEILTFFSLMEFESIKPQQTHKESMNPVHQG